jgi:serine/threonine protein kinase
MLYTRLALSPAPSASLWNTVTSSMHIRRTTHSWAVETNLRSLIDDKSVPLGPAQQNKIALHLAKGMEYLHSYNVTHRDLKVPSAMTSADFLR